METPRPTYDRRRLEELLPDYAFGRLSSEEAREVERALSAYPELAAEVEELRAVFGRLDTMEYLQELERRSSLLSVLVLNRWKAHEAAQQRLGWWKPIARVLLPALALALFAVWWKTTVAPTPEPPTAPLSMQSDELSYTEGLVSFAYWTSGLPPIVHPGVTLSAFGLSPEEGSPLLPFDSAGTDEEEPIP